VIRDVGKHSWWGPKVAALLLRTEPIVKEAVVEKESKVNEEEEKDVAKPEAIAEPEAVEDISVEVAVEENREPEANAAKDVAAVEAVEEKIEPEANAAKDVAEVEAVEAESAPEAVEAVEEKLEPEAAEAVKEKPVLDAAPLPEVLDLAKMQDHVNNGLYTRVLAFHLAFKQVLSTVHVPGPGKYLARNALKKVYKRAMAEVFPWFDLANPAANYEALTAEESAVLPPSADHCYADYKLAKYRPPIDDEEVACDVDELLEERLPAWKGYPKREGLYHDFRYGGCMRVLITSMN
jgi:hypothetical protein